ncbi:hypothetical protein JW960_04685 [candidate division KSB1 bacterium]|nr:hypothetical protein [candidate division KSB1 bacterium]
MAQIFENTRIVSFQPKQEKDKETQEVLDKLVFRGETKLDNSLQITELFAGFRKKLITVKFAPYGDFETELQFHDVSIEDFTVKNKIEKIGSGKDAERIPVESVHFKMAVKMDETGDFLKQLYSIFNYSVKMEIG